MRATAWLPKRSAQRPASGAASAPAAPAMPNAPATALPSSKRVCSITARVDQNALKPTASSPCAYTARRSGGCPRHSPNNERSNAG